MSDLSEVFCVIDTREKNQSRINAVKEFVESHGGATEFGTLSLCDYKLEGIFREKEICLGIEAKSLSDFSGSYQELPDKLARSFELYNDVALFVEIPQIKTSSSDGFHATILNPSVPDGSADVLQYAVLQNSLASWQSEGVHVRQLQNEAFWGYAIASVLISITKDTHRGLEITKVKDFKSQYLNILSKFDGIGQKTALKVIKNFPNLYWLCTYSEDDLKDAIGKVTGSKLYQFIHNNDLITSEWANKGSKTQISKETEKSLKLNPEHSSEVKNPELKYLDENKPVFKEVSRRVIKEGKIDFDALLEEDKEKVYQNKELVLAFIKNFPKGVDINKVYETFSMHESYILNDIIELIMQEGDIYEPKLGLLVATNPLQSSPYQNLDTKAETLIQTKDSRNSTAQKCESEILRPMSSGNTSQGDNPASQTLAGAGSKSLSVDESKISDIGNAKHFPQSNTHDTLPEAPDNSEFKANPRLKDVVEFIRRHPRTTEDVGKEFGFSPEYCLKALYALKDEYKKVWFEKATLTWQFGCDKNPVPIVADKDYDIGLKGDN